MNSYVIKRFILICIIIFLADRGLGYALRYFHESTSAGHKGKLNSIIETPSQIIVLGSSRAASHYVSPLAEKLTTKSVVNAGIHGSNMALHYGVEDLIFKQQKPRLLVFDAFVSDFRTKNASNLHVLRPYYDQSITVRQILDAAYPFEQVKFMSWIYPFNSDILTFMNAYIFGHTSFSHRGYEPLLGKMATESIPDTSRIDPRDRVLDTNQFAYFDLFLQKAKEYDVKVVVVFSPIYGVIPSEFKKQIGLITDKYHVETLDFSYLLNKSSDSKYYNDEIHLNDDGAHIFTDTLFSAIKSMSIN